MPNQLAAVAPKLLAQGLLALRNQNVMPALVNNSYSDMFATKGTTVDIPIPSAVAAQDVAPSATAPNTADVSPTLAQVTLDQWKEAPFYLTDLDMQKAMEGTIPMQASEAVKSLADAVNAFIFSQYKGIYGTTGTPGSSPFATNTSDVTNVRKVLNKQLAPMQDRRMVCDPDAEANALNLQAFQNTMWSGSPLAIQEGKITRKLGFDWFMDQQVPYHTAGTISNGSLRQALVSGGLAAGNTSVNLASATLTGTLVKGDIFTVAGDPQTYVVTGDKTAAANAMGAVQFYPANKVAWAANATVTVQASHAVNLAFHRDAIAFASRPLSDSIDGLGNIIQAASDPVSGLSLRLEISREHKRTRFSYDILYGATLVRPELAARVAG